MRRVGRLVIDWRALGIILGGIPQEWFKWLTLFTHLSISNLNYNPGITRGVEYSNPSITLTLCSVGDLQAESPRVHTVKKELVDRSILEEDQRILKVC